MSDVSADKPSIDLTFEEPQITQKITHNQEDAVKDTAPDLAKDLRAEQTSDMRRKVSGLGNVQVSAPIQARVPQAEEEIVLDVRADDQALAHDKALNAGLDVMSRNSSAIYAAYWTFTSLWVAYALGYFAKVGIAFTPQDLSLAFITAFGPAALLWYAIAALRDLNRVKEDAQILRAEMRSILLPNEKGQSIFTRDLEELCRQATNVSETSAEVLKSLQRARHGLRAEVRDFSGVSKKAEFHIDRLAQSLQDKNAQLAALTETIETKTKAIGAETEAGVNAWDQATQRMIDRSADIESALKDGADRIIAAADDAEGKTASINEKLYDGFDALSTTVNDVTERLDTISIRFEGHTNNLQGVVDNVSEETERVSDVIKDQISGLEESAHQAVDNVMTSVEQIIDKRSELEQSVGSVADVTERLSDVVQDSMTSMKSGIDFAAEQAQELEDNIRERTQRLNESIHGISKQADLIEKVGDEASNKLSESLSVAVAGAESISFAVRRAVDGIDEGSSKAQERADRILQTTALQVEKMQDTSRVNADLISEAADLLASREVSLSTTLNASQQKIVELTAEMSAQDENVQNTFDALYNKMMGVSDVLERPLRDVRSAISEADARHGELEETLRRRTEDLNSASDKATETAELVRTLLRSQIHDVSTLSGQLSGHNRTVVEQLKAQKDILSAQVDDIMNSMVTAADAMQSQMIASTSTSDQQVDRIQSLIDSLAGHAVHIQEQTQDSIESLGAYDGKMEATAKDIAQQSQTALQNITQLAGAMDKTASDLVPMCDSAIERADSVQKRYSALSESCHDSAASNLQRLQDVGIALDDKVQALRENSNESAGILQSAAQRLQDSANTLSKASDGARERIGDISGALREQSEDIHILTDQVKLKTESLQKEMNAQYLDFSDNVGQSIVQLREAGQEFVTQANHVQDEVNDSVNAFRTIGIKAREETFLLGEAAEKVTADTETMAVRIGESMSKLASQAYDAVSDIKKAGDTITIRSREISEQMKAGISTSELYNRELKVQAQAVASSGAEAAQQISKATSLISSSMDDINRSAHDANAQVKVACDHLSAESERLMHVSSAALESTHEATDVFTRQSEALFKASRDVVDFTQDIRKMEGKVARDNFLSSSKFVMESLHSLSVDVSRLLDGEVSDRSWRSFQRGDVSVFTRKLAELEAQGVPLQKAREKFQMDSEFRSYVQRYIRQFEELYDQAVSNDHGALLTNTIGSSDVARLYQRLCQISDRPSKVAKEVSNRAA